MVFAVRVQGIGAKPYSAERLARELCALWADATRQHEDNPLISVRLEEPEAEGRDA